MEVNDRFSLSHYLIKEQPTKASVDGINSPKFRELISSSQKTLQSMLNNTDIQATFKNKSVSMLFLDKIPKLLGQHHPDSLEANKFMFGPSFFPSMELIRHLSHLKNNPALSKETVQNLEKWITLEQACLPICMIFDAWLLADQELEYQATTKGDYSKNFTALTITPPPSEVEAFSNALANEMKYMQPGNRFKLPAGSVKHFTRLELIKNIDGTFDIIHFNTGLGALSIDYKTTTAHKYPSIPSERLEDPGFWNKLVEAKMQPDMKLLNDLLNKTAISPPVNIAERLKKPLQYNNSCSFHAVEAEFKHSFISSFPTIEEGWNAYKQCTSLMASEAVKNEGLSLEPSIERMLVAKEQVRRRYLDWMSIIDNPEKLQSAKNAYMGAIASLGDYSQIHNEMLIENLPPLMALSLLDKRLNQGLNCISFAQLNHIRNTYEPAVTFNDFNHMGHKQLKWLESTREVFKDVIELAGWKGDLLLKIRELSSIILPMKWNNEVQERITYALLDDDSLTPLLTDYILREDPAVADQLIQTLIKEKMIDENFSFDGAVLFKHMSKLIKSDLQKALILARKLEGEDQHIAFSEIVYAMLAKGNVEEALDLTIERLTESSFLSGTLRKIFEKCETVEILKATKVVGMISDEFNRIEALQIACFELAERRDIKEVLSVLWQMPEHYFARAISRIFSHLRKNKLGNAIEFMRLISNELSTIDMDLELPFRDIVQDFIRIGRRQEAISLHDSMSDGPIKESIKELLTTSRVKFKLQ